VENLVLDGNLYFAPDKVLETVDRARLECNQIKDVEGVFHLVVQCCAATSRAHYHPRLDSMVSSVVGLHWLAVMRSNFIEHSVAVVRFVMGSESLGDLHVLVLP
jgi:predicted RNase H-like nuclease